MKVRVIDPMAQKMVIVTTEPLRNHDSVEEHNLAVEIHPDIMERPKQLLPRLKAIIAQYPQNPIFRNYLASCYIYLGKKRKARKEQAQIVRDFPDYAYGRLVHAFRKIQKFDIAAFEEIMANRYSLFELAPDSALFHLNLAQLFYTNLFFYHALRQNPEMAGAYLGILTQLAQGDLTILSAKAVYLAASRGISPRQNRKMLRRLLKLYR